MASFAAIFAIGKPVAFDASALDRETRGFISMTTSRPVSGWTANWMLQPPVSTPTARSTAMPTSRICWYSTVGEGHRRGDGHRVAGVHAHRVDVLDRADDDHVVAAVAHQLELVLLPAEHRLLDEDGVHRGVGQAVGGHPAEHRLVGGDARAEAAHGEAGPDDDRVADLLGGGQRLLDGAADRRARGVGADRPDDVLEDLPVLAAVDRVDVGADELDAVLLQHAVLVQADGDVERGLPAEGGQQRVGALLGDDLLDELRRQRLDVGGVGDLGVGHDRRRVAVDQADPQPLGAQHAAGLGAGVVELGGLADEDRPGADDHHVLDVGPLRHSRLLLHQVDEPLEERGRVVRAGRGLRVELHAERRHVQAAQALDDVVVEADVADLHLAVGGVGRPVERRRRRRSRGCGWSPAPCR